MADSRSAQRRLAIQRGAMTARVYPLVQDCVARGIERGWHRAHKHTDTPGPSAIREGILEAVMAELSEAFVFGFGLDFEDRLARLEALVASGGGQRG